MNAVLLYKAHANSTQHTALSVKMELLHRCQVNNSRRVSTSKIRHVGRRSSRLDLFPSVSSICEAALATQRSFMDTWGAQPESRFFRLLCYISSCLPSLLDWLRRQVTSNKIANMQLSDLRFVQVCTVCCCVLIFVDSLKKRFL